MPVRRAKCLTYLGSEPRPAGFRHFYRIDRRPVSFFTSVRGVGLPEDSQRVAAAHAGLANLVDLVSITLPRTVVVEGIRLSARALEFWERTSRNVAAERIAEDHLPAPVLDVTWRSTGSLRGPMQRLPAGVRRRPLLAMSGGKESLTILKLQPALRDLFFLRYADGGAEHSRRLMASFERTHRCVVAGSDIARSGPLCAEYGCTAYGMFVIGHIVFSSLFFMDRFSHVIIGNEFSANFGNGTYDGVPVNHQYDKSFPFARELNDYLARHVTDEFSHHSPFWKWYEYRIAREFFGDERYLDRWTSCNYATARRRFCGRCAKCAFVFLLGTAHTSPRKIQRLMGSNMLHDLKLIRALADYDAPKPTECVGTKEEVWVALEDIWQKQLWRNTAGLRHYGQSIRPRIAAGLPALRRELLRDQRPAAGNPAPKGTKDAEK